MADFSRMLSVPAAFGRVACNLRCLLLMNRPLALGLLKASLVTLIAAGEVQSLLRAIMASATLSYTCGRAMPFGTPPTCVDRTEAPSSSGRASFGVCGLLALPTIHQIFGDNTAQFPRLTRDEACVFSS